jgi:hypothetical protein
MSSTFPFPSFNVTTRVLWLMAVIVADFETLPALATVPCAAAIAEYAENSVVSSNN